MLREERGSIGARMRALRTARALSQREVAARIGCSDSAFSKWEAGESSPDADVLIRIADTFEVSLDYLLRGPDKTRIWLVDMQTVDELLATDDPDDPLWDATTWMRIDDRSRVIHSRRALAALLRRLEQHRDALRENQSR
jgi:transcriptional regulator with XRE-family HTH domain